MESYYALFGAVVTLICAVLATLRAYWARNTTVTHRYEQPEPPPPSESDPVPYLKPAHPPMPENDYAERSAPKRRRRPTERLQSPAPKKPSGQLPLVIGLAGILWIVTVVLLGLFIGKKVSNTKQGGPARSDKLPRLKHVYVKNKTRELVGILIETYVDENGNRQRPSGVKKVLRPGEDYFPTSKGRRIKASQVEYTLVWGDNKERKMRTLSKDLSRDGKLSITILTVDLKR